jgi:hypothetical protein
MKKLLNYFGKHIETFLMWGGCAAIVYGLSLWNPTVAWVAAGILLMGIAFVIGSVRAHEPTK